MHPVDAVDCGRSEGSCSSPEVVLLAEEDDLLRERLTEELRSEGYLVVEAEDALEAEDYLELASEHREQFPEPDVIVCEAETPGFNGLDLLAHLRQHAAEAHIVLLHDRGKPEIYQEALQLGAEIVLEKPLEERELSTAVYLAG